MYINFAFEKHCARGDLVKEMVSAIYEIGFDRYEDTEMLVEQGLEDWGLESLITKAREDFPDIDIDEVLKEYSPKLRDLAKETLKDE